MFAPSSSTGSSKRSRKTTTKWNLFFSYFNIAYAIVSGVLLVPLYLKNIPLDIYGAWLASGNVLFWLSAIDVGLTSVVMQRVGAAYGHHDLGETGGYLTCGFIIAIGISTIILLVGILLSFYLPEILALSASRSNYLLQSAFMLAVVGTSLTFLGFSIESVNSGLQGSFGVGVVAVLSLASSLIIILVGIITGMGIYAIAMGVLVRGIILLTGNLTYLLWRKTSEKIPLMINKRYFQDLTKMLGYSSLGTIGFTLSERMDAFLMTRFLGPEITPMLILTRRGPDLAEMVLCQPGNAFAPTIAHLAGEGDWIKAKTVLSRLLRLIIWGVGISVAGFMALNEEFVTLWVGSELYAGDSVNFAIVTLLLVGLPIRNMCVLCNAMGDIKGIALVEFIRGIVTLLYMIVGIYYLGILGAALAPILGMLTVTIFYVPRSFINILQLNASDMKSITNEFILVSVIGFGLGQFLPLLSITSWLGFLANSFLIIICYFTLLMVTSNEFRREIKQLQPHYLRLFRKIYE